MKSRFTPEEIRRIVQESRSEGVAVTAHLHSISEQTLYNWRKRLGITDGALRIGELKRLQDENARLKRLVAERDLEIDVMKETNVEKNGARVTAHLETDLDTPWPDAHRSLVFAGIGEAVEVGNKS